MILLFTMLCLVATPQLSELSTCILDTVADGRRLQIIIHCGIFDKRDTSDSLNMK